MESVPTNDMHLTDDPEGGCIVQADDPQMLADTSLDGAGSSGNNSWYWTSMLKLMEQGTQAPVSTISTHSINNDLYTPAADPSMSASQQQATEALTPPPSASSPSSSSVHDQPVDMVSQANALNVASDPDSSVWAQEFLSGPIGENKTSSNLACSDDGLHELLYPRTVLELLFSDQLKLEQMPSWPDILQAHSTAASAGGPVKSFGFPLTSDAKNEVGLFLDTGHDHVGMDNSHVHMKLTQYLHNHSPISGIEDRLSSSTTSSTLSDNAIDQWAAPQASTSGSQCADDVRVLPGRTMAHSSPLSNNIQHMDHIRVKQEYNHVPSPTFSSDDQNCIVNYQGQYNLHHQPHNQRMIASNNAAGFISGFELESMINNEYEQKPNLLSKLWSPDVLHANDPVTHMNHKHHIYESITAANFSHNLRQLTGYNFQSSNKNINAVGFPGPVSASLQSYLNQPPAQPQIAKKSRPFHDDGGAHSAGGLTAAAHDPHLADQSALLVRKDESNKMMLQQATAMNAMDFEDSKPRIIANMAAHEGAMHMQQQQQQQQQLPATTSEYNTNNCNFNKRSRTEQPVAAPPPSSSSTSTGSTSAVATSTNHTASHSIKNQPVRKEKLSERIATLQQLVSPFGKTDTASVLLEAIGYIKFLQEQVQALSSPYFKSSTNQSGDRCSNGEESKPDLRSRGLCLVPLSCTLQVANDNGADYWYGGSFR